MDIFSTISPRIFCFKAVILTILISCLPWTIPHTFAHEIRPTIVEVIFVTKTQIKVKILVNLETLIIRNTYIPKKLNKFIENDTYNDLRNIKSKDLSTQFTILLPRFLSRINLKINTFRIRPKVKSISIPPVGDTDLERISTIILTGVTPENARFIRWSWAQEFGPSVIRVSGPKKTNNNPPIISAAYVSEGKESDPIFIGNIVKITKVDQFLSYFLMGFTHIIPKGSDHILFIIGLFLLSAHLPTLFWQITSFTIAHSISLALGTISIITVPAVIVEPLIALSIIYIAIENTFTNKLSYWRPIIILVFGIIHGLGFADVLTNLKLESESFFLSLFAFNIGVETGQLLVNLICFMLLGYKFAKKEWYHTKLCRPASIIIGLIGGWWFIQRVVYQ